MSDTPARSDDAGDLPANPHGDEYGDPPRDPPASVLDGDRYAHLPLADGSVVIYDREQPDTWVQSDYAIDVGG